jgi:hypothetical protein
MCVYIYTHTHTHTYIYDYHNQPPIQWVRGGLSLRVKRPGREADHTPPPSAGVKEYVELYLHSPNTCS